jgi:transcriptional regulator with XRE-family HTH domain
MAENFLRKIRIEKGKTQAALAKELGVSRALLCGFEKEKNGVSDEVLSKLANALGVTTSEIMTGNPAEYINDDELEGVAEAVEKAFKLYGEKYDKKTVVKIGTELYRIMADYKSFKDEKGRDEFKKNIKSKAIVGLAATCFLDLDIN